MPGYAQAHAMFPGPGTADYAWIITKDLISEPGEKSDVGVMGPSNASEAHLVVVRNGGGRAFRMLDDDGEVYYHGRVTGDSDSADADFGPLDDYGTPNAGCTEIQYYENHRWVTL